MFPIILFIAVAAVQGQQNSDTLVLTHVLFRHGDRNPEANNLYKNDPSFNESFYPEGYGQLIKQGKQRSYNLGVALRNRYKTFLPDDYNIKLIEPRSSDFNRTKESLQAVLAGLFPPTPDSSWLPNMPWQPIAYNYVERERDKELFCFGCPNWDKNFEAYLNSSDGALMLKKYEDVFTYVQKQTGEDPTLLRLYYLYFGYEIQGELGYVIPEWAGKIYPQPLLNLTVDYYSAMLATTPLKRMAGGYLLKKIVSDTAAKVNNTLSPPERQMFLYAGHENNIASVLDILGVSENSQVTPYCSYVLLELHNINDTHGLKIFYQDNLNTTIEPRLLKMRNCSEFCPLDEFVKEIHEYISMDDSVCYSAGVNLASSILVLTISIWIFIV